MEEAPLNRFLLPLLVLLCLFIFNATTTGSNPNYLHHYCLRNRTSADDYNAFTAELRTTLSSLLNYSSIAAGYNNATSGRDPTRADGVFLCRGDVTTETCRNCVSFATADVIRRCPASKEVIIWYDECFLRYSNQPFFGTYEDQPRVFMRTDLKVTDRESFNRLIEMAMEDIPRRAAGSSSPGTRKFATTEVISVSATERVYGLAQCLPYLSSFDCYRCLKLAFTGFPEFTARDALLPSCQLRFRLSLFYHPTPQSPLPPVASPPRPPVGAVTWN